MIQGHLNFQFDFFSTDPGFPTSHRVRITSKAIHWKYIHQNESGLMWFPLFGTHGKPLNLVTVFPCVQLKGNYINPLSFRCHSALIPLYVFAVYLNCALELICRQGKLKFIYVPQRKVTLASSGSLGFIVYVECCRMATTGYLIAKCVK